ncbi:uncharacterized protein J3R85_012495 [Psidium guajava]|nr:uncharacterized protein J3R85_012495 [Psidium guajava]
MDSRSRHGGWLARSISVSLDTSSCLAIRPRSMGMYTRTSSITRSTSCPRSARMLQPDQISRDGFVRMQASYSEDPSASTLRIFGEEWRCLAIQECTGRKSRRKASVEADECVYVVYMKR